MEGVHPDMIRVARRAIELTLVDFGIPATGGLRTAARQAELFATGKSKLDGVRKKSQHQSGRALDVYAYVKGAGSWDRDHLAHVATAMFQAASELGVAITWGGLWTRFPDSPHFQLA